MKSFYNLNVLNYLYSIYISKKLNNQLKIYAKYPLDIVGYENIEIKNVTISNNVWLNAPTTEFKKFKNCI